MQKSWFFLILLVAEVLHLLGFVNFWLLPWVFTSTWIFLFSFFPKRFVCRAQREVGGIKFPTRVSRVCRRRRFSSWKWLEAKEKKRERERERPRFHFRWWAWHGSSSPKYIPPFSPSFSQPPSPPRSRRKRIIAGSRNQRESLRAPPGIIPIWSRDISNSETEHN